MTVEAPGPTTIYLAPKDDAPRITPPQGGFVALIQAPNGTGNTPAGWGKNK